MQTFDYENSYPKNLILNSVEEVQKRVIEAESRIKNGEFFTQEDYGILMYKFWQEESEDRIKAYENGEISSISMEEVFSKYQQQ